MSSFQTYKSKSTEAVAAFYRGDYRQSATLYLESFQASPSTWVENRWQVFHGYTSILQEEYFVPSSSDMEALANIVNSKSEGRLYRCEAAFTAGLLHWNAHDRLEAAAFYRDSISQAEKAANKERRRQVMATLTTPDGAKYLGLGMKKVGALLDEIKKRSQDNLQILENDTLTSRELISGPIQRRRSDGTPFPPTIRRQQVSGGPNQFGLTREQSGHLLSVGGHLCDYCKKSRTDLGMTHLKSCSRCKRAYYCSAECQKQQWRAGHKDHCRKEGEIKPGDYFLLKGIQTEPGLNGKLVQIVREIDGTRWATRISGGARTVSIASTKLEPLRPLK